MLTFCQKQKCSLNSTELLLTCLFTQLQQEIQQPPSAPPAVAHIDLPSMGSMALATNTEIDGKTELFWELKFWMSTIVAGKVIPPPHFIVKRVIKDITNVHQMGFKALLFFSLCMSAHVRSWGAIKQSQQQRQANKAGEKHEKSLVTINNSKNVFISTSELFFISVWGCTTSYSHSQTRE